MVERTPALQSRFGVEVNAKTISIPATRAGSRR
jgi:hypothetical protein